MKKEIRPKTVILTSLFLLIALVVIDLKYDLSSFINFNFVNKQIDNITSRQTISPQRLFVTVWRTVKNEYFDISLNNQSWLKWRNRYLKHIKTMEDAEIAINTMLASLNDPYTKFLKAEVYNTQKNVLDSKVTGIGITLNKSGENIIVNHVLENSPAQKNQILPGDVVISLNGKNITEENADDILSSDELLKNDVIRLKIKRNNKIVEKKIKKTRIPVRTMDYKITKDNIAIVILATIMGEDAVSDFKKIIEETNNTKGLIIDLRDNYGGIFSNAVEMANFMLQDEKIVSVEARGNNNFAIFADGEKFFKDKPVVVIVNKNTASAAEILTGALKDNLKAVIVGENTFGKNSIQQIIPLYNNTGLVITSNRYILPKGEDIHNSGIVPDVPVKNSRYPNGHRKDSQMEEALKIINSML